MAHEDDVDALLAALAAVGHAPEDDLAAASAEARSHRWWSRQQAAESSTLHGVLLSLAEREDTVTVHSGPWTNRGRLRSVTENLVIVEMAGGLALLPTPAITMVESPRLVDDDRELGRGPDLGAVLATLVVEHPVVRLLVADGTEVAGTLLRVGRDIACVRQPSSVVTVRLQALAGCVLGAGGDAQEDGSGSLGSLDDLGSG